MRTAHENEQQRQDEPRIPLGVAAKKIGKRLSFLRQLVEAGKLTAYVAGGSRETKLFLTVRLSDARRAVDDATRYIPMYKPAPKLPRYGSADRPETLHPALQRILERGELKMREAKSQR